MLMQVMEVKGLREMYEKEKGVNRRLRLDCERWRKMCEIGDGGGEVEQGGDGGYGEEEY